MSLLSKVNDIDTSNIHINNDLVKISRWAYQWKMSFNPDIKSKQQKFFFFLKGVFQKTSLNIIKETIAYNRKSICKIFTGLCRHNL